MSGVDVSVVEHGIRLVAGKVRALGEDRTIVNEMAKEIRRAAMPVRKDVRTSALVTLPSGGGLNAWTARASVTVQVRRSGPRAGVTIKAGRRSTRGRADLRGLDAGRVRHPLWGNRRHWYSQGVTPGFFTDPVLAHRDDYVEACATAVLNAARKVGL